MMISLRAPTLLDEECFISAMIKSRDLHFPFISAPCTSEAFHTYIEKSNHESECSFVAWSRTQELIGVFNLSNIIHGVFKSAYLGYYASIDYAGKGLMSKALKIVLKEAFISLGLHRIEANIQPTNTSSIRLVTRNGFLKEGFSPRYLKIHGIWQDHFRFALTLEDWLASQ